MLKYLSMNKNQDIQPLDMNTAESGAQGQALLAGLVGFIRPFIDVYAPATGITSACQGHADFDSRAKHVCNGVQGKELLSALGRFIKDLTVHDGDHTTEGTAKLVISKGKVRQGREIVPVQPMPHVSTATSMKTKMLPLAPMVINEVHQYVSNEMPIRMLAFDSNGMQIRLVERGEVAEEIKSRLSEMTWATLELVSNERLHDLIKWLGRYAILSHTWFQGKPGDVVYSNWKDRELNPKGNSKVVKFCKVAAHSHGVVYGWMDTVCIDKSSSTELDESIRSMYRWYRQSHVCITYLADTTTIADMHSDKWFTRGWTLQELLAPQNMVFYDKDWAFLARNDVEGTDNSGDIFNTFSEATQSQIFQATTIDKDEIILCFVDPELMPISRIFQLASRRQITRKEDSVYSLMGLLGVSISVAYGEGLPAAFRRLVREIMVTKEKFLDVFNHSDRYFLIPSSMTQYEQRSSLFDRISSRIGTKLHSDKPIEPILMTHLGVQIPLLLVPSFTDTIYEAPISSGRHPPSFSIEFSLFGRHYYVLNQDKISAEYVANFKPQRDSSYDHVIFLGILNFGKSESLYHISNKWLCVPFVIGSMLWPIRIPDLNANYLSQESGPVVISDTRGYLSGYTLMEEQDLRRMGMQVATLYLH